MTSAEPHRFLCPGCGRPTPAGALAGLCPACLLAQGLEGESNAPEVSGKFQPPAVEEIARLFPQLEILGLLGAGGMGAVYKARQPALDRTVALKVLPVSGAGGGSSAERFNREARALARLSHPNIVSVYEFGDAGGLHFFIMEFVDGTNLRQLQKAARLSSREALQIVPQICDALQFAHDEGIVHRDIKPENVLVDRRGRVRIADFGLAKIANQETGAQRLTAEGQVMGTPHYMAPEQIERPLAVDHRADIYALGVVLYEMLTGDLPLGNFAPPSRKVTLDVRLDDVVLRALENDPARRYQRASEVKTQVETIAESPVPAGTGAGRKRRALLWIAAAVIVAGGGWFAVSRWLETPAKLSPGPAPAAQTAVRDAQSGIVWAGLPGRGTVALLAVANVDAAPNQWWRPDGSAETETTYELASPADSREAGRISKDLLFRITDLPSGSDGPFFDATPEAGVGYGGSVSRDGKILSGLIQARFAWPPDARRAIVRAGFALEPWRTIATQDAHSPNTTRKPQPGDPGWRITFHKPSQSPKGEAQISVVFGPEDKRWSHGMTAVDAGGAEHTAGSGQGSPIESVMMWTYTFRDLKLADIREFRLRVRPLHWIEFPDVALEPAAPLPAARAPRFAPGIEVNVTGLIDLDSGRAGAFPPETHGAKFIEELSANILWTEANGYDAAVTPDGLHFLGLQFAEVKESDWEALTESQLMESFRRAAESSPRDHGVNVGARRTFRYKTREGGFGLLRTLPLAEGEPGVTVTLKRIQR